MDFQHFVLWSLSLVDGLYYERGFGLVHNWTHQLMKISFASFYSLSRIFFPPDIYSYPVGTRMIDVNVPS